MRALAVRTALSVIIMSLDKHDPAGKPNTSIAANRPDENFPMGGSLGTHPPILDNAPRKSD